MPVGKEPLELLFQPTYSAQHPHISYICPSAFNWTYWFPRQLRHFLRTPEVTMTWLTEKAVYSSALLLRNPCLDSVAEHNYKHQTLALPSKNEALYWSSHLDLERVQWQTRALALHDTCLKNEDHKQLLAYSNMASHGCHEPLSSEGQNLMYCNEDNDKNTKACIMFHSLKMTLGQGKENFAGWQ